MQKFHEYADKAIRSYMTADHITHMTYPVLKDPKLLLLAITHLNESFENAVSALLFYDYHFKRISFFPADFSSKLDIFKRQTCNRYGIPRSVIQAIEDVREINIEHKQSEMEFRRKNNFIIASKNYRLRTINSEKLKSILTSTKPLISKVQEVKKLNDKRTS